MPGCGLKTKRLSSSVVYCSCEFLILGFRCLVFSLSKLKTYYSRNSNQEWLETRCKKWNHLKIFSHAFLCHVGYCWRNIIPLVYVWLPLDPLFDSGLDCFFQQLDVSRGHSNGNINFFLIKPPPAFIDSITIATPGWDVYNHSLITLYQENRFLKFSRSYWSFPY